MNLQILLQQIVADVATSPEVQAVPEKMNLWKMTTYGGPIMLILGIMLALAVYIFIERVITINKASQEDKSFMSRVKDYIHEGKIDSAQKLCRDMDSPASRMIDKGISRLGRPMSDVLLAVENVGNLEVSKLEKSLVILATISGGAPMLGFLGTVTGMVLVFFNMTQNQTGVVQLTDLSSGMYQAMVTTVGGLIVGILAYFGYNYLISRVDSVVRNLESKTLEFMDLLNEPSK
jgi:biopolymer transport protein ExbB